MTGAKTPAAAAQLLGQVGVPNALSADGTKLIIERACVRAYVPWGDARYGAAGPAESVWVRLDAGLKLQQWSSAVSLKGVAAFDQAAYLAAPNAKSPQAVYESQLLAAARARSLCNTVDEALYQPAIKQPALSLLPVEHPGEILASLLTFARPPTAMRWTVGVDLPGASASFELAELGYRALSLRYVGATAADEAALLAAGDITNVVPYQVRVAPVVRLDGVERARGAAALVGTTQMLTVRTTVPQGSPRAFAHRIVAGAVYGLSLSGGVTTDAWAAEKQRAMAGLAQSSPEFAEAAAHAVQSLYAHRSQSSARRLAALTGHVVVLDAFESLAGRQLLVTEVNGLPVAVRWGLYFISANDSMTPVPRDGNPSQVENLTELFGLHGSWLESQAWEETFSRRALSSVSIIHAARAQGVPVDVFTSGTVAGLSGYSSSAMTEMNEALAAGWKVTAPRRTISFEGYLGSEGYILLNPVDGTGGYKVSFDLNGGGSSGPDTPGSSTCPACSGANPAVGSTVDIAAAEWRESWVDLTLPGIGLPLVFSRTYASRSQLSSPLGPRWMHSYATHLRLESNGDVTWVQDDLRTARFSLSSPGVWAAPAGYFQRLSPRSGGGYRLIEKDGFTREFDDAGRLARLVDTSGNVVTLSYSGPLLTEVRDASGQVALTFTHVDGALTRVTDRAGRHVDFTYTGGNLTGFTDALGHRETYGYTDSNQLMSFTDVRGFTRRNFYDAAGRWAGARDALGHESRLLHDAVARRAVYFDKTGAPMVYEWGTAGELLATVDAVGNESRVTRNAALLPITTTDGRGLTTGMTYDARGNVLSVTHPDGRAETLTYEATFNRLLTHAQTGLPTVTNTYDTAGRLKTRTDGVGTTAYGYDAKGQLETVTAPGSAVQRFGYDASGNMTSVTDATNRTMTLGYDAAGHLTSTTDSAGKTRTMVVDALGRLESMTDELHRVTRFTRNEAGQPLTTTNALQQTSSAVYDALGRQTAATDSGGATRRTEYDAEGRVVASIDALGRRTTRTYDAAGRLVAMTDAAGFTSTVGYCADVGQACADVDALGHVRVRDFDAMGRVTTETDEVGRVTRRTYDSGGRLKLETGPMQVPTEYTYSGRGLLEAVTTPVLNVAYSYDVRGNRTQVLASNSSGAQRTTYTFDAANRLLNETNPLNQVTRFTYDAKGNRETKVDGKNATTGYGYDEAGRLIDITFADGTAYAFRFDALGRRVSEASSTHARSFTYDTTGRVETVTDGQTGAVVTSGYDAEGRRTLVSEGGVERRFEYDARGLLKRLKLGTGGWLDVTHDALGRRTSVTRPNGVRSDWLYDEAGQLKAVLHTKGGVVLEGFSYGYDAHGLRTSKTRVDGTSEAYGYDGADRLVRVDEGSGRSSQYALDFVGNRTSLTVTQGAQVTTTTSVSNAFNQLTSSTRTSGLQSLATGYVYDSNGNLTSETVGAAATTYTWDADNRLRQVAQPSLLSAYEYDANGLRTKKVEAGVETRFLLDGQSVLAEFDSANVAARRYLHNPESIDDIYEFSEGGQTYFPLTDALGSVVAITDSTGAVVRRNSYEVYGARSSTGTGPQWAFGFTGREQDVSGLNYNLDRFYMSRTGNWLQADRAGMIDGPNLYQYVRGRPVMATDPTGFASIIPIGSSVFMNEVMLATTFSGIGYELSLLVRMGSTDLEIRESSNIDPSDPLTMGDTKPVFSGGGCAPRQARILTRIDLVAFWNFAHTNRAKRYRPQEAIIHEMGHAVSMIEQMENGETHMPTIMRMSRHEACNAGRAYRREIGLKPEDHDPMGGAGPMSECAP